jgi:hypothetical protein
VSKQSSGGGIGSRKHGVSGHGGTDRRSMRKEAVKRNKEERRVAEERERQRMAQLGYTSAGAAVRSHKPGRGWKR